MAHLNGSRGHLKARVQLIHSTHHCRRIGSLALVPKQDGLLATDWSEAWGVLGW